MKSALRISGFAGAVLFAAVFAMTFLSPIHLERAARGFIEVQIERQLGDTLKIIRKTQAGGLIQVFSARQDEDIAALRNTLATGLNARIADTVGRMQDLSCDCRKRMAQALDAATALRLSTLERAKPQLQHMIEGRYGEIVTGLLRDIRVFAGVNLLAFLLLFALSIARPDRIRQLFVPGILLGISTLTASAFYLFGQNWFFTLLYADFTGFAYAAWLVLIFALLCDIALFKSRVTSRILDMAGAAVATPC